ncbi:MAG: hypothetical protein AABO58_13230 [Acidobacteriota bacterium]
MTGRRADLWCVLLLVAIPTALFADVLILGTNFYIRDLYRYHFPMKSAVRAVVAAGEFPYWNPFFAGGQPMAANPAYEIFYPPQWLIFLGDYDRGFALHILVHVYLALLGMYALLRALPLRPGAALAGALSFGMGGLLLGTMTNLPTFFVWSWAGLGGWAALRFVRAPSRRTLAVAAVILAMPMLVAEPVALGQLWALIAVGAWIVDRRSLRFVLLLLATVVLLSAVQLLTMVDHVRDSARARGFSYHVVIDYSMPAIRPVELLTPHAFGIPNPEARAFWGSRFFPRGLPYLISIYCGLFAAVFAIGGAVARVRGSVAFLAIAATSYLFAIGVPFRLFYAIGLRSIRYPEKFAAMGVVAMIVFAAVVADRLLDGDERIRRAVLFTMVAITIVATGTAVVFAPVRITALLAAAWAVVLWRRWPPVAALVLLVADLAPFANEVAARLPREFFTPPPLARALPPGATLAHRGEWLVDDVNRRRYEQAAAIWLMRNSLRPLTPAAWGIRGVLEPDIDETFLLPTHDLMDAFQRSGGAERVIALTGADYVAGWRDFDEARRETDDVSQMQPLVVRRTPYGGRYRTSARILAVRETPNSATIDVEAAAPSPLVILVTRHKYWRVTIDGRDAAVSPANIAYQSVLVPAGRHRVAMRYRNPLIAWGALVSAFVLVAITVPTPPRHRLRSGS